ncbi:glycosyltransferase [Propionibacterium sp.]|uniref:glycosyltransferase n=1 Tax=Propionibacterium sp. TaxID=1977903 RepID=UPI0039E81C1A
MNAVTAPTPENRLISFVLPVYNEGVNVDLIHKTLMKVTADLSYNLEFVYVNDGSSDDSFDRLRAEQVNDPRIKIINFSRNYGHQLAITAGMDYANGDAAVIMDSDLQDPPSVALELIKKWEEGYDVVFAQRRSRHDTFFKRTSADMYYRFLEKIGDIRIPRNTGDFRLMDRKVIDEVKKYREHDRYIRGMVSRVGFRQVAVAFDRDDRVHGETHYPLNKMLKLASDGILGFSTFPLRIIARIGYSVAALSIIGILWILISKIVSPQSTVPGWSFIVIAILFVGGLQLIMLGILGSYIGRIYREVQDRPLYSLEGLYVAGQESPLQPPEDTQHQVRYRIVDR